MVGGVTYRNPAMLAKVVSCLDVISKPLRPPAASCVLCCVGKPVPPGCGVSPGDALPSGATGSLPTWQAISCTRSG
jgi:hypothetical protein